MAGSISVRDVAMRANVSVGTVSNVLNNPGKVTEATAKRVQTAIDELGFVPNGAARQLRAGRSTTVGFVVLDIRNPFFTDVAKAAEARAQQAGLSIVLADSDEQADRQAAHLAALEQQRVSGVLITPVGDVGSQLARLRARGIPAVLVDHRPDAADCSSVSVDDLEGGRRAAQHLVDTGRRRILFIGGPLDLPQVRDRLVGAREVVRATPGASLDVLPVGALTVKHCVDAGREILALDRRPDAVFAANDLIALGVLQGVGLIGGMRVPDELAIIGYDDIDFAESAAVPISSIRQPRDEIGAQALELLLADIAGEPERRHIVFEPELVARASTGV